MTRLIAWACLIGLCYVGYRYVSDWRNPWAVPALPVTAVMPPLPGGCAQIKECL